VLNRGGKAWILVTGKPMFSSLEKSIISLLQGDLPLTPTPYADMATELGISEEILLAKIKEFKKKGIVRRLGVILYHQRAGYNAIVCAPGMFLRKGWMKLAG
jgi:DNA-binding Lrp family transcriptional regulator